MGWDANKHLSFAKILYADTVHVPLTGELCYEHVLYLQEGKSKQTNMPYFESGWVDEKDAEKEKQRKANGGGWKFW